MKTTLIKTQRFNVLITLCISLLLMLSCESNEPDLRGSNVNFTPCRQDILRSGSSSDKVDVEFTDKGVEITYYNFEVTCDFNTVNVTHTFKNGFLNITQEGYPNQANCVCYTDVSYTIEGVSQKDVNVIFINGKQVYCYNKNYPKEIPFEEYSLIGNSCKWMKFDMINGYGNAVIIINSKDDLENYIDCIGESESEEIDFSTHTLLFAHGVEGNLVVVDNDRSLQQLSDRNYSLKINLLPYMASVITYWQVPIVIKKIPDNSIVELVVTKNP